MRKKNLLRAKCYPQYAILFEKHLLLNTNRSYVVPPPSINVVLMPALLKGFEKYSLLYISAQNWAWWLSWCRMSQKRWAQKFGMSKKSWINSPAAWNDPTNSSHTAKIPILVFQIWAPWNIWTIWRVQLSILCHFSLHFEKGPCYLQ